MPIPQYPSAVPALPDGWLSHRVKASLSHRVKASRPSGGADSAALFESFESAMLGPPVGRQDSGGTERFGGVEVESA